MNSQDDRSRGVRLDAPKTAGAWAIGMALALLVLSIPVLSTERASAEGAKPGFRCETAKADVLKIICASPSLSALDAKLNDVFSALENQGAKTDAQRAAVQADEDEWRVKVRNICESAACLESAYSARIKLLTAQSLGEASPAVAAETGDFPASANDLSKARSFVGKSCPTPMVAALPGAATMTAYPAIVQYPGSIVSIQKIGASAFAFLMVHPTDDFVHCKIADFVTLPSLKTKAGVVFTRACRLKADEQNFGLGIADGKTIAAYWSIDRNARRFIREAIGVMGGDGALECREPENGE